MSSTAFGTYTDAPRGIEQDSSGLNLTFSRTDATTGTISWNVPPTNQQTACDADNKYNGLVIVGSEQPIATNQRPVSGTEYQADPSMNRDIHLGDEINGALVLGTTYGDRLTRTLTVTGLIPGKPYYFAGFASDNVYQYASGSYSYSLDVRLEQQPGHDPYSIVLYPKQPTDPITLEPGLTYHFKVQLGDGDKIEDYPVVIDPSVDVITDFQSLIDTINDKLIRFQADFTSTVPPNKNNLYLDHTTVKMWDGYRGVDQPTIVSATDPTTPSVGDVWYDTTSFYRYDGNAYHDNRSIVSTIDPTNLPCEAIWITQLASNPNVTWVSGDIDPTITPDPDGWVDGTSIASTGTTDVWAPASVGSIRAFNRVSQVWVEREVFEQPTNPLLPVEFTCNSIWYDGSIFYQFVPTGTPPTDSCTKDTGYWVPANSIFSSFDPSATPADAYWFNPGNGLLHIHNQLVWTPVNFINSATEPVDTTLPWYNPIAKTVNVFNSTINQFQLVPSATSIDDPTGRRLGHLWFDGYTVRKWDSLLTQFIAVDVINNPTDPDAVPTLSKGDVWWTGEQAYQYDGSQFVLAPHIFSEFDPTAVVLGDMWFNPTTQLLQTWDGTAWVEQTYITAPANPMFPATGTFWVALPNVTVWNGVAWSSVILGPHAPATGYTWYDTTSLWQWNGIEYVAITPDVVAAYDQGNIRFTGKSIACAPKILIIDGIQPVQPNATGLFKSTRGNVQRPVSGQQTIDGYPLYNQHGVGTDGNQAHRRELSENILFALGYPSIQVELTKAQLQFCVDQALQELRRRSSIAYERTYFFLQLEPGMQHYQLANECVGFNKVVSVLQIHRVNATFLGKAEGHGAFGQLIMQQLYQMGTFDMVSYHIMSDYMETLEIMTAGRMQFTWNEHTRRLSLHQRVVYPERIMLDVSIERTEQSIMQDRMCKNWILNWALAEAKQILAGIRGKYQTQTGAAGGVALNASDLQSQADKLFEQCKLEVEEFIASDPENWGMASTFVVG